MLNKQQEQFESGVSMPELWANRYFKEYEVMFRIVFYH